MFYSNLPGWCNGAGGWSRWSAWRPCRTRTWRLLRRRLFLLKIDKRGANDMMGCWFPKIHRGNECWPVSRGYGWKSKWLGPGNWCCYLSKNNRTKQSPWVETVPELKQGRSHGKSKGTNFSRDFSIDARFAHAACHCFNSGTVSAQAFCFVFNFKQSQFLTNLFSDFLKESWASFCSIWSVEKILMNMDSFFDYWYQKQSIRCQTFCTIKNIEKTRLFFLVFSYLKIKISRNENKLIQSKSSPLRKR